MSDEVIRIEWYGTGTALQRPYFLEDLHVNDRVFVSAGEERAKATEIGVKQWN